MKSFAVLYQNDREIKVQVVDFPIGWHKNKIKKRLSMCALLIQFSNIIFNLNFIYFLIQYKVASLATRSILAYLHCILSVKNNILYSTKNDFIHLYMSTCTEKEKEKEKCMMAMVRI